MYTDEAILRSLRNSLEMKDDNYISPCSCLAKSSSVGSMALQQRSFSTASETSLGTAGPVGKAVEPQGLRDPLEFHQVQHTF